MIEQAIEVIDDKDIRFTPDGKVAVLDVINALSEPTSAGHVWEEFKRENPDLRAM
jgi:hypothetical protein